MDGQTTQQNRHMFSCFRRVQIVECKPNKNRVQIHQNRRGSTQTTRCHASKSSYCTLHYGKHELCRGLCRGLFWSSAKSLPRACHVALGKEFFTESLFAESHMTSSRQRLRRGLLGLCRELSAKKADPVALGMQVCACVVCVSADSTTCI